MKLWQKRKKKSLQIVSFLIMQFINDILSKYVKYERRGQLTPPCGITNYCKWFTQVMGRKTAITSFTGPNPTTKDGLFSFLVWLEAQHDFHATRSFAVFWHVLSPAAHLSIPCPACVRSESDQGCDWLRTHPRQLPPPGLSAALLRPTPTYALRLAVV